MIKIETCWSSGGLCVVVFDGFMTGCFEDLKTQLEFAKKFVKV
jgi:hypothetical protein